jgi:hypothetical protein
LLTEKNAFIPTKVGFGSFDFYEKYARQTWGGKYTEVRLWGVIV